MLETPSKFKASTILNLNKAFSLAEARVVLISMLTQLALFNFTSLGAFSKNSPVATFVTEIMT